MDRTYAPGLYHLPHPEGRQGSHAVCMIIGPHEVQKTANIQIGLAFGGDLYPWKFSGHPPHTHPTRCENPEAHRLTSRGLISGPH